MQIAKTQDKKKGSWKKRGEVGYLSLQCQTHWLCPKSLNYYMEQGLYTVVDFIVNSVNRPFGQIITTSHSLLIM